MWGWGAFLSGLATSSFLVGSWPCETRFSHPASRPKRGLKDIEKETQEQKLPPPTPPPLTPNNPEIGSTLLSVLWRIWGISDSEVLNLGQGLLGREQGKVWVKGERELGQTGVHRSGKREAGKKWSSKNQLERGRQFLWREKAEVVPERPSEMSVCLRPAFCEWLLLALQ